YVRPATQSVFTRPAAPVPPRAEPAPVPAPEPEIVEQTQEEEEEEPATDRKLPPFVQRLLGRKK
ncbi:MAG: hypothetical protein ACI4ST_00930, partial [Candidatus Gallimonas sp.]